MKENVELLFKTCEFCDEFFENNHNQIEVTHANNPNQSFTYGLGRGGGACSKANI